VAIDETACDHRDGWIVESGDFDGDGKSNVLWRDTGGSTSPACAVPALELARMSLEKWYLHLPGLRRLYAERTALRRQVATFTEGDAARRYLDPLELCLCGLIYRDGHRGGGGVEQPFDAERRDKGQDWPQVAHTMIGRVRLSHLRRSVERVLDEGIPGDFIETGVWRGGACILMRGILAVHGVTDRVVHLADSFCGLPPPDANYPADADSMLHRHPELAVPRAEVEEAFRCYGLLDGQARFHEGHLNRADGTLSAPQPRRTCGDRRLRLL
jgi:hypothetical protein